MKPHQHHNTRVWQERVGLFAAPMGPCWRTQLFHRRKWPTLETVYHCKIYCLQDLSLECWFIVDTSGWWRNATIQVLPLHVKQRRIPRGRKHMKISGLSESILEHLKDNCFILFYISRHPVLTGHMGSSLPNPSIWRTSFLKKTMGVNFGQEGRSSCCFRLVPDIWHLALNRSHKEESECGAINMRKASSLTPNYVSLLTPEAITFVKT